MKLASKLFAEVAGACAVLIGTVAACVGQGFPSAQPAFDLQGHRGARGLAPENTLAAFERAIELGVTTLELDVAVTRDGEVVVAHDPFVSPHSCLGPSGEAVVAPPLIRDLSLAEVQSFDCGSVAPDAARFPSPPWKPRPGEVIPTLGEVFELVVRSAAPNLQFNVETKIDPTDARTVPTEAFVAAVVGVVQAHGMSERTTLQSFDWRALVIADRLEPRLRIAALVEGTMASPAWHAGIEGETLVALRALKAKVDILSPESTLLTDVSQPGYIEVEAVHALGWKVIPWTVNRREEMEALIDLGVDGLITDYPDVGMALARERGLLP